MDFVVVVLFCLVLCSATPASCLPLKGATRSADEVSTSEAPLVRLLTKRYIDSSSSFGASYHGASGKIRTRRSAEEREEREEQCERLRLCELHARSGSSPLAAFQLYFVNRENARLWDHRARSPADCRRRFSCDR